MDPSISHRLIQVINNCEGLIGIYIYIYIYKYMNLISTTFNNNNT